MITPFSRSQNAGSERPGWGRNPGVVAADSMLSVSHTTPAQLCQVCTELPATLAGVATSMSRSK